MSDDFELAYQQLREVMLRSATGMQVLKDTDGDLQMRTPWAHPRKPDVPVWFGMVKRGKTYVSYHLMPLYMNAPLAARIPATLARRKQGKTCFNFKRPEPELFAELATLTEACAAAFTRPMAP
jgi:hypothetical protein